MPTRPSTDHAVDAFVARIDMGARAASDERLFEPAGGAVFRRISAAPWVEALEAQLPRPFPPSFRSLVMRYAFPALDLGPVHLFANTGDLSGEEELATRVFADRALSEVLLKSGYVQLGSSTSAWYDPVCFDAEERRSGGECAIVRLDHEAALTRGEARVVERIADSFLKLLGDSLPKT
jgi:hypothetical protein